MTPSAHFDKISNISKIFMRLICPLNVFCLTTNHTFYGLTFLSVNPFVQSMISDLVALPHNISFSSNVRQFLPLVVGFHSLLKFCFWRQSFPNQRNASAFIRAKFCFESVSRDIKHLFANFAFICFAFASLRIFLSRLPVTFIRTVFPSRVPFYFEIVKASETFHKVTLYHRGNRFQYP